MNSQALIDTTRMMVADGKRLLAMDESNPTCNKRFAKWGTPQNSTVGSVKPENAASMLTPHGVDGALIGGASLHAGQFLAIVRVRISEAQTKGKSA